VPACPKIFELLGIAEETVKVYSDLLDLVKVRRAAGKE